MPDTPDRDERADLAEVTSALRHDCDVSDRDLRKWVRVPGKYVRAILDALDAAEAERDGAVRALNEHRCDEQAERAYSRAERAEAEAERVRAEVARLTARPAPAWDEEAAWREAVRLYPTEHVGYDHPVPSNCRCDECYRREVQRDAYAAGRLAVVRPDREAVIERLAARWWDLNTGDTDTWESLTPDEREAVVDNENLGPLADAVLDLWPGRSEAEVKREGAVEALREAARKADGLGIVSGSSVNVGDRASAWLNARAARLAAEGGAS